MLHIIPVGEKKILRSLRDGNYRMLSCRVVISLSEKGFILLRTL